MNILFIHHRYHTNLFNWFRGFQENGHKVHLLVYKKDKVNEPDLPKSNYLPPSKMSSRKMAKNHRTRGDGVDSFSPYYYPSLIGLYRVFKQIKPDIVVIRPVFSRFGYLTLLLALLFRCRIVFHSRIRIHRAFSKPKLLLLKVGLGILNAHWMSPCKGDSSQYALASRRLVYFPFSISPQLPLDRPHFENGKINILCVAKYFKSKNPKMMLDCFLLLRKKYDNITLTICGTGDINGEYYLNMLKTKTSSNYDTDVQLLINEPLSKMTQLYSGHDIFVLPTKHDPASFTVLEAMSHGLATITTRVDGAEGYISEGKNGFVFDPINVSELLEHLSMLIEEKEKIPTFGRMSHRLVLENHDPRKVTREFIKRIEK